MNDMSTTLPIPKRFTRSEYYRLINSGVFDGQRLELIEGEIVQMPPLKNAHVVATGLTQRALEAAFGKSHWVRVQAPLHLTNHSEPEPDVAVVKGSPRDFKDHPKTALLVVEVSDSTLLYDQSVKGSLYARDIVLDYWIVNLVDNQLEVYRKPVVDRSRQFGYRYSEVVTLTSGQTISPLAIPRRKIAVADLLP
jgi:Uma2 family endonuclease